MMMLLKSLCLLLCLAETFAGKPATSNRRKEETPSVAPPDRLLQIFIPPVPSGIPVVPYQPPIPRPSPPAPRPNPPVPTSPSPPSGPTSPGSPSAPSSPGPMPSAPLLPTVAPSPYPTLVPTTARPTPNPTEQPTTKPPFPNPYRPLTGTFNGRPIGHRKPIHMMRKRKNHKG